MKTGLQINTAKINDLIKHFNHCNKKYILEIEEKIPLSEYFEKILTNATFYEYWNYNFLVGLAVIYENRGIVHPAFMTNLSIAVFFLRKKIASKIMQFALESLKNKGFTLLILEVKKDNNAALRLYEKLGFSIKCEKNENSWILYKNIRYNCQNRPQL